VQKPNVPDSIQSPAGEELVLMVRATGFQIYVCQPDADGKPAWTLKAPDAELFDEQGKSIGKHFGGPLRIILRFGLTPSITAAIT
jgi:hypothetical protein